MIHAGDGGDVCCPNCACNLTGLAVKRCPECGASLEIAKLSRPCSNEPASEVYCPTCEYNLTGLTERRCPECGNPFDLEKLRRLYASEPTSWYLDDGPSPTAVQLWIASFTQPARLVTNLPRRVNSDECWRYSLACYLFGAVPPALAVFLVFTDPLGAMMPLVVLPVCWLGCELTLTGVFTALLRPRVGTGDWRYWRRLTHATSGFAVATGAVLAALPLMGPHVVILLGAPAAFFGWFACLSRMVLTLCGVTLRAFVALLLIMILGATWIGLGALMTSAIAALGR